MQLTVPAGVFRPIADSRLLADTVQDHVEPGMRVLDLCTGSGIVALAAARCGAEVTAVDVSETAVEAVAMNAERLGVSIHLHVGNLFDPVDGRRFDLVTANPPYVPDASPTVPTEGLARAWAAGPDGRLVLDEICDRVPDHLRPAGAVLIVHSSLIGETPTIERLEAAGSTDVDVIRRLSGPIGPLMRRQQEAGRVPAGTTMEDLVVIRGRAQ